MNSKSTKLGLIAISFIIFVGITAGFFVVSKRPTPTTASKTKTTGCVTQTLTEGSSGACVIDAKAMVNYIETSGLNECTFTNGTRLADTDTLDAATTKQIKSVQAWTSCYNKQEGSDERLQVSGKVDSATWATLCSYGYKFAKQSQSSTSNYRETAIIAGKAAGCE